MGIAEGIIAFLVIVVPIAWTLYQKHKSPIEEHRERYETTDQDLAKRDSLQATAHASDDLDTLDRLRLSHGQGDKR